MKLLKKDGFSLVELLAVIVILGILTAIGIGVTTSLTDKARQTGMDSYKSTITMSAQTYLQNNKNLVPKVVGETKKIPVKELRTANYLTEDIKNSKGESCMENSYVRVYKLSNTEYTYTTYLYCGDDEVPDEEAVPKPIITAKFTDSSGEIENDKLNNVSDAYLFIEITAATATELEQYKNQKNHITLDGYSFKIYIVKNGIRQEAYNSGSLSAGRQEKILINKRLQEYIDVTGVTEVSLEVTANNTLGGIKNVNKSLSETGEVNKTQYEDNVRPKCVAPANPFVEEDWLNKQEYNMSKESRKLTVGCDDGTGSQCIRTYFTESWPNDKATEGAEFVYIKVKDNAGNVSCTPDQGCSPVDESCKFRVNVDIKAPSATITAHVGQESNSNDSNALASKINQTNVLKKVVTVNDGITEAEIKPTDEFYKDLYGVESVKWMNKAKYPHGVVYKIVLSDNLRLDKWSWLTNEGYIDNDKDARYKSVNSSNPEATSGMVLQDATHGMTDFHGSINDTVYVRFLTEGRRYGEFTAYDKAGNSVKIIIAANIDRTAPPIPENIKAFVYNKVRDEGTTPSTTSYTFKKWTNRYVRVETDVNQNVDNLTNKVTLAGFWQFYYEALNDDGDKVGTSEYNTYTNGIGIYDFYGKANEVDGKNKIKFKGCDKANNCSEYTPYKDVWIDITVPKCDVEKITNGSESKYGWLGKGETARVQATCSDKATGTGTPSGCTNNLLYHDYTSKINTTSAGAQGNGNGGSFTDHAGNVVNCTSSERIQIDHIAPTCHNTGGNKEWTNKSRTVTGRCSDTGGSGCVGNISHTYSSNTDSTTAGPAGLSTTGYIYDKADNKSSCPKDQIVKVDTVKPHVEYSHPSNKVYKEQNGITVTATCVDDFSGLSSSFDKTFTSKVLSPSTNSAVGKCCQDLAGNRFCGDSGFYEIQHYGRHQTCGIESRHECRATVCGVETYNSCRTKDCGVNQYKSCATRSCGTFSHFVPRGQAFDTSDCPKYKMTSSTSGGDYYSCAKKCRHKDCGVSSYAICEDDSCGVKTYKKCENSSCRVKRHSSCWSYYEPCSCESSNHPNV